MASKDRSWIFELSLLSKIVESIAAKRYSIAVPNIFYNLVTCLLFEYRSDEIAYTTRSKNWNAINTFKY